METDRIRLWITGATDNTARVTEIRVWPASVGNVPPLPIKLDLLSPVSIFLNQSGFNSGAPKRFTAPAAADGTAFTIRPAAGGEPVFKGTIQGNIGDFTAFEPASGIEYVVATADGKTSVPFRVGPWWLERVTTQLAVDFMIDSRHYVGNERRPCGGSYGWRDDHHFGWELHTLVPQWLSNPSAYARLPRQITYEAPKNPKLWGKLQPPAADAPDLVKLIHWGADVIVTQNLTHELLKSQLAYFLYAWPVLKDHLPAQNYEVVRDFAFANWATPAADRKYPYDESPEHNLLALKTKVGTTKGAYPPGFSVQPNLLMHEVAKREGRPDADLYLQAAVRQAEWMIANLDWNDPLTTKGQRMSEFVTVTGLAQLLADYPDRAPAGLAKKLNDWAAVVIRRSENLWDFRKLGDAPDQWTPIGDKPQMWNEVGNVVGLPAAIFAAKPFITDPAASARLEQIAWSHFDAMFGRNPTGRHFSFAAAKEIEGVKYGWYIRLPGGVGRLENARFVLDGSAKNQHFPFHPEVGNVGWTEGWIQHNTPFNLSLAYLARSESALTLKREGNELVVRLRAPLNFDYTKVETGVVTLVSSSGDRESVTVTEESASSPYLSARIKINSRCRPSGRWLAPVQSRRHREGRLRLRLPRPARSTQALIHCHEKTSPAAPRLRHARHFHVALPGRPFGGSPGSFATSSPPTMSAGIPPRPTRWIPCRSPVATARARMCGFRMARSGSTSATAPPLTKTPPCSNSAVFASPPKAACSPIPRVSNRNWISRPEPSGFPPNQKRAFPSPPDFGLPTKR